MPITTVADLLATLKTHRLLDPAQLDKLASLQSRIPDPQSLVKKLVSQGWLTSFQGSMLLQGKGNQLLLDKYVLLERIGEGGMGEVYKAKNTKMNKVVALKIIRKERLKNANAVKRFLREVEIASQLSDPNIVTAYDAGQVGNLHYLAMEYVDGIDMGRLVKEKGPLPIDMACEYMRQAASGLAHAHERGLVHRDIKPNNLLVTQTGRGPGTVKILDLGLARMADIEDSTTLTQEGSVLGTLDYLSPEQALNAHQADIRSDLYSLGCTFYYILTGQVPFSGGTAAEKLLKHRLEEPIPLEKVRPEVPAGIVAIVRKLMAKRPEDRFQTPEELLAALANPAAVKANGQIGRTGSSPAGKWTAGKLALLGSSVGAIFIMCGCLLTLLGGNNTETAAKAVASTRHSGPAAKGKATTPFSTGTIIKPTQPQPVYVKKATREETIIATLKSAGLPTLEGRWHWIGYFDNADNKGFDAVFPPETEIDLSKSYPGKANPFTKDPTVRWRDFPEFQVGRNVSLILPLKDFFSQLMAQGGCVYLYHEIHLSEPLDLPFKVGADDGIKLWLNREQIVAQNHIPFVQPPTLPPERHLHGTLRLRPGKNQLLIKVTNLLGDIALYLCPEWPERIDSLFGDNLRRDFGK